MIEMEGSRPLVRSKPVLLDLEADFRECAGEDGKIDAEELAVIWTKCAQRKADKGQLSDEDRRMIRRSARMYLDIIDVDNSGRVSCDEFLIYMLGGMERRGALQNMRQKLTVAVEKKPGLLGEIIGMFRLWDQDGDGYVSKYELRNHMGDLLKLAGGDPSLAPMMAEEFLNAADLDDDGRVDLWELVAHTMGRRKTPVELLLYDISKGVSKRFSPLLLGRSFEAIYHSGVLVYGNEYWFGGQVFKSNPPCSQTFGPPLTESVTHLKPSSYRPDLRTVHLGYTLLTEKELKTFLVNDMKPKYNPETYDVLTNNCNCFSNDVVRFLTGTDIPREVSQLPQLVMNTPTVKLLRPVLNKWLGGFKGGINSGERGHRGDVVDCTTTPAWEVGLEDALGAGALVVLDDDDDSDSADGLVACVIEEIGDSVQLRCFDPTSSEFIRKSTIRQGHVKRIVSESPNGKAGPMNDTHGLSRFCASRAAGG